MSRSRGSRSTSNKTSANRWKAPTRRPILFSRISCAVFLAVSASAAACTACRIAGSAARDFCTVSMVCEKVLSAELWPQAGQKNAAPSDEYLHPHCSQVNFCLNSSAALMGTISVGVPGL